MADVDYDAELRYDRAPVPTLQASAPERVIYLGSASKVLAPAVRIGWMVVPIVIRYEVIAAGLHLLITVPDAPGGLDDGELTRRIRERGVVIHPLSLHRQLAGPPGFVPAYAAQPVDQLREAVRRMAAVPGGGSSRSICS